MSKATGDPVMLAYRSIFKDCIGDFDFGKEGKKGFEIEVKERYAQRRPPGYKDAQKPDRGYGDLLIWKTLLQRAEQRKSDLIFVTGEEKPDWFVKVGEGSFQPRPELLDEFRRATSGKSIHIINLSALLSLYKVKVKHSR